VPHADRARLAHDLDALAAIGRNEGGGIDREAYTPAHAEAQEFLLARAREAGLTASIDAIGNVFARTDGEGPVVLTGSHLDTVPNGGAFDGAVGVIGALEAVRVIVASGRRLRRGIEIVGFAEEEGRFTGLLGSGVMMGVVAVDRIITLRDMHAVTFADALKSVGLDATRIDSARREPREIAAFVELHVEQGPVLHARDIPIGIVTAIAGTYRLVVQLRGRADHAGATPMDARRDPILAAAAIIRGVRDVVVASDRPTARGTVGIVEARPGVSSVVAETVRLVVDIRDVDAGERQRLVDGVLDVVRAACAPERIDWATENPMAAPPGPTDESVRSAIAAACDRVGVPYLELPSGASHDAQNLASHVPTGMIFVPSRDGRSHSPAEHSDIEDIARGVDVLIETLVTLASAQA
jgi:hydantoinase/carbamoylase family amidase